jgi:hypothetical protein
MPAAKIEAQGFPAPDCAEEKQLMLIQAVGQQGEDKR